MEIKDYLGLLPQWMAHYGFAQVEAQADFETDGIYNRSKIELTKLANVDTYCVVKYVKEGADAGYIEAFSKWAFKMSYNHRTGAPVGFVSMLVTFPLVIVENITPELQKFIAGYCPKHFAAAEFPVILDITTRKVYRYEKTPIWGYAYYKKYRSESYELYSPEAWMRVNAK